MQEYIIEESEPWSLFDQSIESFPSLIYSFLFSLRKIYHLPPHILNPNYHKEIITKFLHQSIPISFHLEGCK
jgi:hypothetical protein